MLTSYERRQKKQDVGDDTAIFRDEHRLREIIRDEIRKYHQHTDTPRRTYGTSEDFHQSQGVEDSEPLTDDELTLQRRRENNDVYDDDNFYERREFEDRRSNKQTPGL